MSDWGKILQDALMGEPDKVPKGWKTAEQIAREIGKSNSHTRALICQSLVKGKLESRRFRIITGRGKLFPVTHYAPIKATPRK